MRAIETALTLIMILLIFGVVLTATENSTDKVVRATETNNMEKIVCEVVDNLINNPGTPDNWNEYGKGTPGLAIVNDEGHDWTFVVDKIQKNKQYHIYNYQE